MEQPKRLPAEMCHELSEELRDMGAWLSSGHLSADQFRIALLTLEAEKVKRFGFELTGEKETNGRVHFELRHSGSGCICSSMDFDSSSRQLSIHQIGG